MSACVRACVSVCVCERESERRGNGAKRAFKNRFDGCRVVEGVVAMLSVRSVYSWSIVHGLSYEKGWA